MVRVKLIHNCFINCNNCFIIYDNCLMCSTIFFIVHDVDGMSLFHRSESGIYYALHVGGTNFRILRIQLGGQRSILGHDVERKPIPQHLMTRTTEVCRIISSMILLLSMNSQMYFLQVCDFMWCLYLQEFFDFVALSLKEFVERKGNNLQLSQVRGKDLRFTFSFPVRQTSISSGTLIKWTKGFAIEDMVSLSTF